MLKMQLDPHFLFNSLNILIGIVHTSPDDAEKFIIRLSRIYRYIIKSIEQDLVLVNNAINFAVDYVALLNIRFPNKLDFQVDASLDKNNYDYIPVMALQLLIENAVKHIIYPMTMVSYLSDFSVKTKTSSCVIPLTKQKTLTPKIHLAWD